TAAKPVTTVVSQTNVTRPRPVKNVVTKAHSPPRRTINLRPSPTHSNFYQKVTTVKTNQVNAVKGVKGNWGNPHQPLKDKGVIDSKDESPSDPMPTHKAPSFVQTSEHIKTPRPSVKPVEHLVSAKNLRKDIPKSRGHRHSRNKKACSVSLLTRSRLVPLTAAKPVTTVVSQTNVTRPRPVKNVVTKAHSPPRRTINLRPSPTHSNFYQKVTTVKTNQVNAVKGVKGNWNTNDDATFEVKKPKSEVHVSPRSSAKIKKHNAKTKGEARGKSPVKLSIRVRNLNEEFEDYIDNNTNKVNAASIPVPAVGQNSTNSTNTFSVAGSGPIWLFDIDTLTKSMNYQPVIAGNQPNFSTGIHEHFDADKAWEGNVQQYVLFPLRSSGEGNVQQYMIFPLWSSGSKDPRNTDDDVTFKVKEPESEVYVSLSSSDKTKKHDDKTKREANGKRPVELSTGVRNLSEEFEDFSSNSTNEGTIEEEVYVYHPLGFEDPNYPNKVYKVVKALYGLHQAHRACLTDGKSASTPIDSEKPLLNDPDGEDVDVHTDRPDIMFVVCACARYQVNPKVSHLHAVKRIFRVGKGFSKVDTSLFEGMLVPQQVPEDVANDVVDVVVNVTDAEPTPPSPTPAITPPPPLQELISSPPQVASTLPPSSHKSLIAPPSSKPVNLKKKDQIMLDEEVALKLQAELQGEFDKEQRLARQKAQKE
nr:hypothetical protein [Tanacetum cinerariifolium]